MQTLIAGLGNVEKQSQRIFRSLLAAMAEPGTQADLGDCATPESLNPASWQVLLAMTDLDTSLWLHQDFRYSQFMEQAMGSLNFHTGCRYSEDASTAGFAIVDVRCNFDLSQLAQGCDEYPDRSATLIVQADGFERKSDAHALFLVGPGIQGERSISLLGPDGDALAFWLSALHRNHAGFPRGVDLIITAGTRLMALPRTTRVTGSTMIQTLETAACM